MEKFQLIREIPVEEGFDIVVAGGGPAGIAAAVGAARQGAKVVLLESKGSVGGIWTNGLLGCLGAFHPLPHQHCRGDGAFPQRPLFAQAVREDALWLFPWKTQDRPWDGSPRFPRRQRTERRRPRLQS